LWFGYRNPDQLERRQPMGITESFKHMAEKLNGTEKAPDAPAAAGDGNIDDVPDRARPDRTDNGQGHDTAPDQLDTMPDGATDM
jgi:hypothetical protein